MLSDRARSDFPETAGQGDPDERVARLTEITYAAFDEELGELP